MSSRRLTREQIASTEKKLDMPLDDIIKMSKNDTASTKKPRFPNKGPKHFNGYASGKNSTVRQYFDSRAHVRQGALDQKRSKFQGNQFPVTTTYAQRAAVSSFRNRQYQRFGTINSNKNRVVTSTAFKRKLSMVDPVSKPLPSQLQQFGDEFTVQRPKTLDALFASMKMQRMKASSEQNKTQQRNGNGLRNGVHWRRGRASRNISCRG